MKTKYFISPINILMAQNKFKEGYGYEAVQSILERATQGRQINYVDMVKDLAFGLDTGVTDTERPLEAVSDVWKLLADDEISYAMVLNVTHFIGAKLDIDHNRTATFLRAVILEDVVTLKYGSFETLAKVLSYSLRNKIAYDPRTRPSILRLAIKWFAHRPVLTIPEMITSAAKSQSFILDAKDQVKVVPNKYPPEGEALAIKIGKDFKDSRGMVGVLDLMTFLAFHLDIPLTDVIELMSSLYNNNPNPSTQTKESPKMNTTDNQHSTQRFSNNDLYAVDAALFNILSFFNSQQQMLNQSQHHQGYYGMPVQMSVGGMMCNQQLTSMLSQYLSTLTPLQPCPVDFEALPFVDSVAETFAVSRDTAWGFLSLLTSLSQRDLSLVVSILPQIFNNMQVRLLPPLMHYDIAEYEYVNLANRIKVRFFTNEPLAPEFLIAIDKRAQQVLSTHNPQSLDNAIEILNAHRITK